MIQEHELPPHIAAHNAAVAAKWFKKFQGMETSPCGEWESKDTYTVVVCGANAMLHTSHDIVLNPHGLATGDKVKLVRVTRRRADCNDTRGVVVRKE